MAHTEERYILRFENGATIVKGSKKTFVPVFVLSTWTATAFSVTLTDGKRCWRSHANKEYIEGKMKPRNMEIKMYLSKVKEVFMVADEKKGKLELDTLPDEDDDQFDLRLGIIVFAKSSNRDSSQNGSQRPEERIHIDLKGELILTQVNEKEVFTSILEDYIRMTSKVNEQNNQLRRENKALHDQHVEDIKQFDKLVQEKKDIEHDLYLKFSSVLNEKKQRIRSLQDQVRSFEKQKFTASAPSQSIQASVEPEAESQPMPKPVREVSKAGSTLKRTATREKFGTQDVVQTGDSQVLDASFSLHMDAGMGPTQQNVLKLFGDQFDDAMSEQYTGAVRSRVNPSSQALPSEHSDLNLKHSSQSTIGNLEVQYDGEFQRPAKKPRTNTNIAAPALSRHATSKNAVQESQEMLPSASIRSPRGKPLSIESPPQVSSSSSASLHRQDALLLSPDLSTLRRDKSNPAPAKEPAKPALRRSTSKEKKAEQQKAKEGSGGDPGAHVVSPHSGKRKGLFSEDSPMGLIDKMDF